MYNWLKRRTHSLYWFHSRFVCLKGEEDAAYVRSIPRKRWKSKGFTKSESRGRGNWRGNWFTKYPVGACFGVCRNVFITALSLRSAPRHPQPHCYHFPYPHSYHHPRDCLNSHIYHRFRSDLHQPCIYVMFNIHFLSFATLTSTFTHTTIRLPWRL